MVEMAEVVERLFISFGDGRKVEGATLKEMATHLGVFGVQPIDEAGLHYHATEGQSHQRKKHRLNHTPLAIADRLGWQWRRIGCMSVHHKHIGIHVARRCHFHNKFSACLKMF